MSPRKVRLVIDLIRGLPVDQALDQLSVVPKRAALPVRKLLLSAVANAEHNFKLQREHLRVKAITANEGPRLKRYQPRAFGRAGEILKRMTHVTIVLEDATVKVAKPVPTTSPTTTKASAATVKHAPSTSAPAVVKPAVSPKKTSKSSTAKSKARDAQDVTVRRQGKS